MEIALWIVGVLTAVIGFGILLVLLYQLVIGIHGFWSMKPRRKIEDKAHDFAVIVCARNEEAVIAELLESLKAQKYPREKFELFVIADNCTDQTAEVSRESGAVVYERFNDKEVGKGYALRWALERIQEDYGDRFDAVTVFDADNVADPCYLYHTNEALCSGADATQGYRETKNPFDNAISGCYAIYWYMLTRFYHQARSNAGLPCSIGGTGFAFKTAIIKETGWDTVTLTEDSEFASRRALDGRHIQLVREAVFYDEQPTEWGVSVKQRKRWMCGTMQESRVLRRPAWKSFRNGNKNAFDIFMMMLSFPALAWLLVLMVLSLTTSILASFAFLGPWWYIGVISAVLSTLIGSYLSMFVLALLSLCLEKKKLSQFGKALAFYPLFMFPMMFYSFLFLFKKDMVWEQIRHGTRK